MKKRFRTFQQCYSSDCGQTCVRMIARHFGRDIDYSYICSLADSDRMGLTIAEMGSLLKKLDFDSVAVNIPVSVLDKMPLPAILYWNQNHYVVLYKIDRKKEVYHIADPSLGKVKYRKSDFLRQFATSSESQGLAIALEPTPAFYDRSFPKSKAVRNLCNFIYLHLSDNKRSLFWVTLLTILILATDIAIPFLFQHTIDDGIMSRDIALIWLLALSQIAIFLGNYGANSVADIILTKLGLRIGINMLDKYLEKLLRMPLSFFSRHSPSDLIQRIDDHNRIKDFMMSMPAMTVFTTLNLTIFGAILIYFSPLIALIFFSLSLADIGWMLLFLRFRREIDYSTSNKTSENRNNIFEIIGGIEEIKASKAIDARVRSWHDIQKSINALSLKSAFLNIYQKGGNLLMVRLRDVVITGLCAMMVVQDQMTLGIMMTVSYITGHLDQPFSNIIGSINSVQDSLMAYQRIYGVTSNFDKIKPRNKEIGNIESLKFENVSFKYPGGGSPWVLKECSLEIPIGQSIAIVGESGCGKSTLLKLISSSYIPQKGRITVNGQEKELLNEESYSSQLGIVMQSGSVFSATILENIGFSDMTPDIEKARKAAQMACIDEFIESLPMGYNTKIGKTGIELSGGQCQRLFIARALYRNPAILILDEATSSLDASTEARIMDNIFRYCEGRTLIVAAHRLSTVRNADKIVVIHDGIIAESGSHDRLVEHNGRYADLIKCQMATADSCS